MARKPMYDGGTKNKLIQVAAQLFFRKGYEGTSIRSITDEVGCEVGLFYYYYKSKDELFSDVMDYFFSPYKQDFEALANDATNNPYQSLLRFFVYMKQKTLEFRARYDKIMHRTMRWAIREQTLTVIEPYIERIIDTLQKNGATPMTDNRTMAIFLSHGVGSVILHEPSEWVEEKTDSVRKTVNVLLGLTDDVSESMRCLGKSVTDGVLL